MKCFGREADEFNRFEAAAENVRSQQLGIFQRLSRFVPSVGFLTHFNVFVLLLYGGWLVMQGEIPLGTGLVVFASLLGNFSNQVTEMAQITNTMQQCLAGARRVFEVLDRPVEVSNAPDARRIEKAGGEITFENVSFSFREGSSTLRELSFHVEPGSLIAILGATGSGKTALLSLIPRFYDPAEGRVLLDGIDLRSLELQSLRRQVGVVFQESFLFSTTIAGNIAFGSPDASRSDIEKAARLACAHEFIEQLPEGYDTPLSEGGSNLSGGQKQRLSIARALLLEPAVLLLDDPTSAIDPDTEHEILNAMESAMRGRTTFVVAHRLSTLKRADRILVLEKGRLIQSGSHSELMQEKGLYRHAVRSQLSGEDILDPRPEAVL